MTNFDTLQDFDKNFHQDIREAINVFLQQAAYHAQISVEIFHLLHPGELQGQNIPHVKLVHQVNFGHNQEEFLPNETLDSITSERESNITKNLRRTQD